MQSESTLSFLNVFRARVEFNHCVIPGNHHCQIVRQITAISANQNVALMVNTQIVLPKKNKKSRPDETVKPFVSSTKKQILCW